MCVCVCVCVCVRLMCVCARAYVCAHLHQQPTDDLTTEIAQVYKTRKDCKIEIVYSLQY